jgi:hypothetical protein
MVPLLLDHPTVQAKQKSKLCFEPFQRMIQSLYIDKGIPYPKPKEIVEHLKNVLIQI